MFDDVRDLYQQIIMEHGRTPKHMRRLEPFDRAAKGDNPMCGDRIEVRLRLADGRVAEAGFEARGCAISIASADMMAGVVSGLVPSEIRDLSAHFRTMVQTGTCTSCTPPIEALRPLAGVHEYPSRIKCATLPWDALLIALENDNG